MKIIIIKQHNDNYGEEIEVEIKVRDSDIVLDISDPDKIKGTDHYIFPKEIFTGLLK
jgi:hypothetical protein